MIMKLAFIVLMMRLMRSWQKFKRTLSLSWRYKMIQTFRWYDFKDYADGDASKQKKERKKVAQSTVHLFILDTCLSSRQNRNAPAQFITATLLFLPYYCFLNFQCWYEEESHQKRTDKKGPEDLFWDERPYLSSLYALFYLSFILSCIVFSQGCWEVGKGGGAWSKKCAFSTMTISQEGGHRKWVRGRKSGPAPVRPPGQKARSRNFTFQVWTRRAGGEMGATFLRKGEATV